MKKYDLHKNNFSKLHFELHSILPYYLNNKEKASRPHRHSFFQLLWFKNPGEHYVDYQVLQHPKNTLFAINQNQIHHFCRRSSNEGYLFHFNDSFISTIGLNILPRFILTIFNEIHSPYLVLTTAQSIFFKRLVKTIEIASDTKGENRSEIVMHQFMTLLYKVEEIKKEKFSFPLDLKSDFSTVVKFKQLIIQNIDQQLQITSYANALGISQKKLTSLTKEHTGSTPSTMIKGIKLLEAKRCLSEHKYTVKEIAYRLGFDQPTYFTKFFKKGTGLTPKQFQTQVL